MDFITFLEPNRRISLERVSLDSLIFEHNILKRERSFDGKVKVWSIDTRNCVATHSETEKAVWSVRWLPKVGRSEGFATAGANRSISFYREATGG
jgi:WD40 repeat protein